MKRTMVIMALLAALSTYLFADGWTLQLPLSREEAPTVARDGRDIALDEYVWYKRWQGLLLERLAHDVYRIEDGDGTSLVVVGAADVDGVLEDVSWTLGDADAIVLLTGIPQNTDVIEDLGVDVYAAGSVDRVSLRRLERAGVDVYRIAAGCDIVIDDGELSVTGGLDEGFVVTCPCCGHTFVIREGYGW